MRTLLSDTTSIYQRYTSTFYHADQLLYCEHAPVRCTFWASSYQIYIYILWASSHQIYTYWAISYQIYNIVGELLADTPIMLASSYRTYFYTVDELLSDILLHCGRAPIGHTSTLWTSSYRTYFYTVDELLSDIPLHCGRAPMYTRYTSTLWARYT